MPTILPVNKISPSWGKDCFIAPNATLVGDVVLGDNCSVWFNAVLRGDVHYIKIGNKTNIQDGAVIHCTYRYAATNIGDCVSVGHNALVPWLYYKKQCADRYGRYRYGPCCNRGVCHYSGRLGSVREDHL